MGQILIQQRQRIPQTTLRIIKRLARSTAPATGFCLLAACHLNSQSSIINSQLDAPPIIGATCTFHAKIYKNVDAGPDINRYLIKTKKNIAFSDLPSEVPACFNRKTSQEMNSPERSCFKTQTVVKKWTEAPKQLAEALVIPTE